MKKRSIYRAIGVWMAGLLAPFAMQAQFLDYGTDPSRLKWNKATLEHYTLIYPKGLDSMAYRYALYLENAWPHIKKTIGTPVKASFPVVLHPADMSSNGMVSWSPRRMELLTTPSFTQQAERWDKHLVVHESRHVIQTGKLMTGVFRPFYYLLGEQTAGISSFFVPRWFFEGDAVGIETAMSDAGRGRLPEFQMIYKAQMFSDTPFYSFDKWYLGSYKDETGNFYALGYNLTSFARHTYGADIWDKTTSRYVSHPVSFPPFSNAFRHHTGIGFDRLFKETFDFLHDEWESRDTSYAAPTYHTPETRRYTSYRYPQVWNDSAVIAVKSSLSDIQSLVSVTGGREKRLAYMGSLNSRISLHNNRVYWIERIPGIRWEHENHSAIKYYDLQSNRLETLTARRRYISFAVADSVIAASLFTEEGESRVVFIDKESGEEYRQYPSPANAFVKELAMGGTDTLYTVAVADEGITILQLDARTGLWSELLEPVTANITSPVYKDGRLYFESGLNGTNNLYRLDASTGKAYRLTSARFGAFQPALSSGGDTLFFADYQAKGYRIASMPLDRRPDGEEADFSRPLRFTLAETLAGQENFKLDDSLLKPADFRPRPYHKASGLINIHSWAPVYYNVNDILGGGSSDFTSVVKPGVTLLSQNALNTAITQAAWYYSGGYHHGMLDLLYKGWFPVIRLNLDYGDKAYDIRWTENNEGQIQLVGNSTGRTLLEGMLQVYLPLNLTSGQYVRGIRPTVSYHFTNNAYQQYGKPLMAYFQYLLSELRFYNYRRMAHRHILPRLGFQLRLQYLNIPFNQSNFSPLYAAQLTTYWPGIMQDHSLMLRAAYQYQPAEDKPLFVPRQLIESPRGHSYIYRTRQQVALKADYAFPILTPDLSIGPIAYLRRLRANLFYDLTHNQENARSRWSVQSSYGADLIMDWNALRISFPLTTGIRIAQPAASGSSPRVEALFSVSF
ncbi:MAG: hypothetical protein LBK65_04295 [Tannerellaceae bacterium]|jgi:hypothetical protein|nr:hypothetical protein [Tannerellaceae bacterium]